MRTHVLELLAYTPLGLLKNMVDCGTTDGTVNAEEAYFQEVLPDNLLVSTSVCYCPVVLC